jgi:hypothetical protein
MDSIAFAPVAQRPRFPSDSELHARAWEPGDGDVARRANKVATDALMLAAKLDAILDRHRGWDDYPELRARADARAYKLPGPLRTVEGWVQFSRADGKVLGVR